MENIEDQIHELKTSVRRQRFAIVALASVLTGIALIGAVRPAGDATFDTITCKAWRVVDKGGKLRIGASTAADGAADVTWFDTDMKPRIIATTSPSGAASVRWFDKDMKTRIIATTSPSGLAGVTWSDKEGKERIVAGTILDGVVYPTKDGR